MSDEAEEKEIEEKDFIHLVTCQNCFLVTSELTEYDLCEVCDENVNERII